MEQGRKWRVAFYRCAHFHGDRIHDEPATLVRDHHREAPGSESIRRILHPFAPDRSLDHLRYLLVQPVGADSPTAYPLSDRPGACARRSALRRFAIGNRPSPIDSDRRFNPGQSPPYQVQPTVIHRSVGRYTRAATGTPQHQQSNRPRQAAGHRCAQKGRRTFSTESRGATPASYARLRLACSLASMRVRVICARTRAGESGHIFYPPLAANPARLCTDAIQPEEEILSAQDGRNARPRSLLLRRRPMPHGGRFRIAQQQIERARTDFMNVNVPTPKREVTWIRERGPGPPHLHPPVRSRSPGSTAGRRGTA